MDRRALLQSASLAAPVLLSPPWLAALAPPRVTQVILVWKCHLDVGFTATQTAVLRRYYDVYFPEAIDRAQQGRDRGDPYTWTTGSWLLYTYLEQASAAQRRTMEQAIARGDIAWHALPFSWQTELLSASSVTGALAFSHSLDRRFGKQTVAAKMTDVPGHTRGIIAPLSSAGILLLDIGVNAASFPPAVPDVFRWQHPSGVAINVIYHRHDYGSTLHLPGTATVFSMQVRNDNSGPHTPAEIAEIYKGLRSTYPGATISSGTLSDVAAALAPATGALPVVTAEIGDTWIHGVSSDSPKLARLRHLQRLRQRKLDSHAWVSGDDRDRRFLQTFLLGAEHTWGTDTKSYLDNLHYRPADLATARSQNLPGYATMERSWQEKRDNLTEAETLLGTHPQAVQPLDEELPVAAEPSLDGYTAISGEPAFQTSHLQLRLDPGTGAIINLRTIGDGKLWASPTHPLALFTYQTLSAEVFTRFLATYVQSSADWAPRDFGKPNMAAFAAVSQEWHPSLVRLWQKSTGGGGLSLIAELAITATPSSATAWPRRIFLEIDLPAGEATLHLRLTTLGKQPNRMAEAMWLSFAPAVPPGPAGWSLDKCGERVDVGDVLRGGNRQMHAVETGICHTEGDRTFALDLIDAPVVALGRRTPLPFSTDLPDLATGIHVNLFNNAWGTNYPQWAFGDWVYRFTLRLGSAGLTAPPAHPPAPAALENPHAPPQTAQTPSG